MYARVEYTFPFSMMEALAWDFLGKVALFVSHLFTKTSERR